MGEDHWHETKIRVRYKDTDRMGVVYYGNYLTFFEMGRSEYMRAIGYSYADLENDGYSFVVTEAAAKYHANVGYDALIRVMIKVGEVRPVRLRFDYRVVDEEGRLLVTGHTVHACLNADQKISRLPHDLKAVLIQKLESPPVSY